MGYDSKKRSVILAPQVPSTPVSEIHYRPALKANRFANNLLQLVGRQFQYCTSAQTTPTPTRTLQYP